MVTEWLLVSLYNTTVCFFRFTYLWVIRNKRLSLGLQLDSLEFMDEEGGIWVGEKLVPVECEAHKMRCEPGALLADE